MSMQTLTWDVDAAAVAGNSDAYYSLALASQARQKFWNFEFGSDNKEFQLDLNIMLSYLCLYLSAA